MKLTPELNALFDKHGPCLKLVQGPWDESLHGWPILIEALISEEARSTSDFPPVVTGATYDLPAKPAAVPCAHGLPPNPSQACQTSQAPKPSKAPEPSMR
jgi:hypothetical protein